ncbi:MAG: hypothetical protein WCG73_02490 [Candidatus Moraniibacteriota bacterium]
MVEKKTTRTKKVETDGGLTGLLMDSVVHGIQSFIDGAIESVEQSVHAFVKKVTQQILLFALALFGAILLLIGLAQILSTLYGVAGSGETLIGVFILAIVFMVYTIEGKQVKK